VEKGVLDVILTVITGLIFEFLIELITSFGFEVKVPETK